MKEARMKEKEHVARLLDTLTLGYPGLGNILKKFSIDNSKAEKRTHQTRTMSRKY